MTQSPIKDFIQHNYRHFNAAVVVDAAEAWVEHLKQGNKMFFTMAGAMSTAELGISLAEMIRQGKIHGISTTGANIEEDLYNLMAHSHYERVPHYRHLSAEEEVALRDRGMNRVTDTCIPEDEAMRHIERRIRQLWQRAEAKGESYFPYEFFYQLLRSGDLKEFYDADPKDSWLLAACEKNLPVYTPGWEDSTLGNNYVASVYRGELKGFSCMKSGLAQMHHLVSWYREMTSDSSLGFFQIGGGIAGDFPICVVPLLVQDLKEECKLWSYFCQISDSTTSYGSYSGAVPNEKITWYKIGPETPRFVIESDASIVAPLIFNYVLGN